MDIRSEKTTARSCRQTKTLHFIIVVEKVNVSGSQTVASHKLLVSRWSLVLNVAGQHALQAHADALDVLDWTPALVAEEIEADDAIRVDVGVYRYRAVVFLLEHHFRRLCPNN